MMNIYVSPELEDIKNQLASMGYNIIEEGSIPYDAIICNLKDCNIMNFKTQGNLKREGTLIIDSGSKSIEDIDYILNNRAYSSLF